MDFYDAIEAHLEWKTELKHAINDELTLPSSKLVGSDQVCELGQWISANMGSFHHLDSFRQLRAEHAAFHQFSGEVVVAIEEGSRDEADHLLEGDFVHISRLVVNSIVRLSRETESH